MAWEDVAAKLVPKEWVVPALVSGVGTGVVSWMSAYLPKVATELQKVASPAWRWWFVFATLMLLSISVRSKFRKCQARNRANQRVTKQREIAEAAEEAARARVEAEKKDRIALYASLRPMDRAILSVFVKTGLKTMTTNQIVAHIRSDNGGKGDGIGTALQRLHDLEILHVGTQYFQEESATLLPPYFGQLTREPELLSATGPLVAS